MLFIRMLLSIYQKLIVLTKMMKVIRKMKIKKVNRKSKNKPIIRHRKTLKMKSREKCKAELNK